MSETRSLNFPPGFLWGAATSSHQIEGGNTNSWSEWEKQNANRLAKKHCRQGKNIQAWDFLKNEICDPQNYISGKAADHWNRWREDFQLMKELGINAYRFSIEWSRIEPKEGEFNQEALNQYSEMIKFLHELDIEPFITLWHWTFPLWIRDLGGWTNPRTLDYFSRYAETVVRCCSEGRYWITINEPEIYTRQGYAVGDWPPQQRNIFNYFRVIENLILAHKRAEKAIKAVNPNAQVGLAKNNTYFQAYRDRFINEIFATPANWWWNQYFLNKIAKDMDFIGLNYYFHHVINLVDRHRELDPHSDMGSELAPYGIYHVLKELKRYGKPIYITENGLADARDERREWFIEQTLVNVHTAMQQGVDVRGYFHWSLLDNFEWDKGFWPKFGLIEVDRKTQERKIRASAKYYSRLIRSNSIPRE